MRRDIHSTTASVGRQPTAAEIAWHVQRGRHQRAVFVAFMLRRAGRALRSAVDAAARAPRRRSNGRRAVMHPTR